MTESIQSENGDGPLTVGISRRLDEAQYEALVEQVEGERLVGLALWEESIADEGTEKPSPNDRILFDLDIYLENKLFLELYGTLLFPDPDSDPLRGLQRTGKILQDLIEQGLWLDEIASTDEDELVLILSQQHQPKLYANVAGWSIEEWETLPGDG